MQSLSFNRTRVGLVCAALLAGMAAAVIWTWTAGVGDLLAFGSHLKPMSPGAALLSLLAGLALYFYYRDSQRAAVRWFGTGVGALLVVACGLVCMRYWLGWDSPVERWLAMGAGRLGNYPVGEISWTCGAVLLLAGLALLVRFQARASWQWLAVGLAAVIVLVGLGVVVSYLGGLTGPVGHSLHRHSLLGGVAFLLLGGALVLGKASAERSAASLWPVLTAGGLAMVIGVSGAVGMRYLQAQERAAAHRLLKSVTDLKAEEITNWRRERLDDAQVLGQAPMIGHDLRMFLAQPGAAAARANLLRWLNLLVSEHRYALVEVFDTNGVRRLSIPDDSAGPDREARDEVASALRTRDVVVQDLHPAINASKTHWDLAVPVLDAEQPVGVVRLVIDPQHALYVILQNLPLAQQTAESALFRVEGREIVALSDLRLEPNTAMKFRLPLEPASRRPMVRAALGEVGEIEGVDYREVPVLASTRKIPGAPWYLVVKVDCAEIYGPINRHAWLVLSLTILMTALVGILAELFWERKRLALAERVEYLMNHANDVILLHDEYLHILEANNRALELYGYSLAELRAMPTAINLRAPAYRADFHAQTDPLFLNTQAVYESVHQRKDGTTLPVEISSRVVTIAGKRYVFSIIRDLTQRKAQEQQIRQLSRYYATLSQINQGIVRCRSRKELFREVCRLAAEHGGFKATWIGWLNRETHAVLTSAAAGAGREIFERIRIYADDRPEGRGTIGTCIRTGQPSVSNNIATDVNLAPWRDYSATYNLRAVASVPVRFHGEVVGAFSVFADVLDAFHQDEINLLAEIATDISFALDTLDLDAKRQQAENELFTSRERYRSVFEHMRDGYMCLQLMYAGDKVADAIYLEVNPAFEHLTGLKKVIGKKITAVMPGYFEANPDLLTRFETVARTGKADRYEEYRQHLKKWIAASIFCPAKEQVVIIFEDTTLRHASDERLRRALESASAIAWEENLLTSELSETGDLAQMFGRLAGYRHADSAALLADIHPADRARVAETWRAMTPARRHFQVEFRICQPAGDVCWLSTAGTFEFDGAGRPTHARGITRDVTDTHRLDEERDLTLRVLSLVNSTRDLRTLLGDATKLLHDWLGCDAVGIRLREGDDFPYYETRGFPAEFVQLENQLCQRDAAGRPVRDSAGQPVWDCLCGNVLSNQFDPTQPFCTARGSFWTNSTTAWQADPATAKWQCPERNRCIAAGYESVALVAFRAGTTMVGLLQINDKRPQQFTAARIALLEQLADSLAEGIARRQSEQRLRANNTLLRTLMDTIPDEVFVKDATGHYLICNAAHLQAIGLTQEIEIIGKTVFDTVPLEVAQLRHADDLRVLRAGESIINREELIHDKDGQPRWRLTSKLPLRAPDGAIVGLVAVRRDIAQRKQIQQALQLRSNALQAAANAVVITDATGVIQWVNAAFTRLTGYPAVEVLGQNPRVLKSNRHDAAFYRQLWETIAAGHIWHGELFNRRKDGREYNEEMTITPVGNEQGQVTHYIAIKQDVTARKESEAALADANRQLTLALTQLRDAQQQFVAQERLRALGQMASGIAHDFNNALTPILGFADLLLQHPSLLADRDKLLHYIRLIHLSAQDAAQIVRRLHEFYRRRRSGDVFLPLKLNALVRDTIELTAPRWRQQMQAAGVTITIQTDLGEIPVIHGNEAELRDALTSLIFNAVDSLPQGGTVTIRTVLDGNRVRLEVADTGTGLSAEARQHCFEPFYNTKGEHGAGLGLALVHGIIRRHEGDITVDSAPGVGTTFTVYLPLNISQLVLTQSSGAEPPPGNAHILVVDDEPQLREVLLEFLKVDHHHVELAVAGADALEKFRPGKFDVVITDRAMPGMSGEQLAATIKLRSPTTPVIMLTGFGVQMQAEELPAGVDLVLSKPIGLDELRAALNRVLRKAAKSST